MIRKALVLSAGLSLLSAAAAYAFPPDPIDLTGPGNTYTSADGTIWTNLNPTTTTQPAGTGVYQPFLREQAQGSGPNGDNGIEEGLSTDAAGVLDNVGGGDPWTHSVLMGSLASVNVGGIDYFSFTLDLNEPSGGGANFLSLDQLKIWTTANSAGGSLTSVAGVEGASGSLLRYNLDGTTDQTVYLDYDNSNTGNNSGSGEDDMEVLIPTSFFAGYTADQYMYFYAVFGQSGEDPDSGNPPDSYFGEDGFEEWRVHTGTGGGATGGGATGGGATGGGATGGGATGGGATGGGVPEPSSMALLGIGIVGLAGAIRRKK